MTSKLTHSCQRHCPDEQDAQNRNRVTTPDDVHDIPPTSEVGLATHNIAPRTSGNSQFLSLRAMNRGELL
jgi:hypothetical protein